MTPNQFKNWRTRLGWTHLQAAMELGLTTRQIYYYESGHTPVPRTTELACKRLEEEYPQDPWDNVNTEANGGF